MADQKTIKKTYSVETKAAQDGSRSLIARISTNTSDRSGDIVVPQGAILDHFLRNPIVLLHHKYDDFPIGKAPDIQVLDNDIVARVEFPPEGDYDKADTTYKLAKGGYINAWSIGFIPKEWEDLPEGGRKFTKWELLEFSAVPVPDNPEALTVLRSAGIEPVDQKKALEEGKVTPNPDGTVHIAAISKELAEEIVELKEGHVLSGANRKAISDTVSQMKSAIDSMEALLKATEKPETSEQPKDSQPPATEPKAAEIPLVEALKLADKVVGRALRDYNATKEN